jgi:hypothetical protein
MHGRCFRAVYHRSALPAAHMPRALQVSSRGNVVVVVTRILSLSASAERQQLARHVGRVSCLCIHMAWQCRANEDKTAANYLHLLINSSAELQHGAN